MDEVLQELQEVKNNGGVMLPLSKCFILKRVTNKEKRTIGYTACESYELRALKISIEKNLKMLSAALARQRIVVAVLRNIVPHCFENAQFQNELTLLEGYKARLHKEIEARRRVKWIESFGQSTAIKVAHSIYEQTKNNASHHLQADVNEFLARLENVDDAIADSERPAVGRIKTAH